MVTLIMKLFGYKKQYKQSYIVPNEYKRKFLKALEQTQKFQTPYWDRQLGKCISAFFPYALAALHVHISHEGIVYLREGKSQDWGKGYTWVRMYGRT